MSHIQNAIITSTRITTEDHGLLSVWLTLDYGGSGQGFGGFHLGNADSPEKNMEKGKGNYAGAFIVGCMRAADVTEWSKMVGKTIRVRLTEEGIEGRIVAIGHIIHDDRWFNPTEVFKR